MLKPICKESNGLLLDCINFSTSTFFIMSWTAAVRMCFECLCHNPRHHDDIGKWIRFNNTNNDWSTRSGTFLKITPIFILFPSFSFFSRGKHKMCGHLNHYFSSFPVQFFVQCYYELQQECWFITDDFYTLKCICQ